MDPPAGIINRDTSEELKKFLDQVVPNAQAVANRSPQGVAETFPAKILARAWDATLGVWAYSWLEQAFDATGNRIDHPSANMGTPAAAPAYAYGDGTVLDTFPFETMLRRVGSNLRTAVAYEFPLVCPCVSGTGSGGGSGGGFVLVPCCPNPIPRTLYATITDPGGLCIGSAGSVPLTYVGGLVTYQSALFTAADGNPLQIILVCSRGVWTIQLLVFDVPFCSSNAPVLSLACHPISGTVTLSSGGGCGCPYSVTVTVTE